MNKSSAVPRIVSAASQPKLVHFPVLTPPDAPKSILVRFWRYWRRLIRRRQDSQEVKRLKRVILQQDERVASDMGALQQALQTSLEEIRVLKELTVPKLERALEVQTAYSENIAAALVRERKRIEAETAIHCNTIAVGQAHDQLMKD